MKDALPLIKSISTLLIAAMFVCVLSSCTQGSGDVLDTEIDETAPTESVPTEYIPTDTAADENRFVEPTEKTYEITEDGSVDLQKEFYGANPYFNFSKGEMIPESVLGLPTGELVTALGDVNNAVNGELLMSSLQQEPSPVKPEEVYGELYSREDALSVLLSKYFSYTSALLGLDEEGKEAFRGHKSSWGMIWYERVVADIDAMRGAISDRYLKDLVRADREALFSRDKQYKAFLCKYYYGYISPFDEIAKTVEVDIDGLEFYESLDCSAYDYEFDRKKVPEPTDNILRGYSVGEILDSAAVTIRAELGWLPYETTGQHIKMFVDELNSRRDAAEGFIEKYAGLVRLTPYVKNHNEYENLFFAKQSLRILLGQGSYGYDVLSLFTDEQLETIYQLLAKDHILSGKTDLLYVLYFSLNN